MQHSISVFPKLWYNKLIVLVSSQVISKMALSVSIIQCKFENREQTRCDVKNVIKKYRTIVNFVHSVETFLNRLSKSGGLLIINLLKVEKERNQLQFR